MMKQLYRYFIGIALIFILMTTALHFLPKFINDDERNLRSIQCPLTPSEIGENVKSVNSDKKKWPPRNAFRTLGEIQKLHPVWDNEIGEDRIVAQMEFAPNVQGAKKNIWMRDTDFSVPDGEKLFQKCPVNHCTIIKDDEDKPIDARLFKMHFSYMEVPRLSASKSPNQVWIMYILESPIVTPDYYLLDNLFNWTATYRRDSTIVTPYEKWQPNGDIKPNKKTRNYAAGKSRMAAIFVSNCDTTNGRMQYVRKLQEYIDVHVYGACGDGTYNCNRFENETACFENLRRHYKFYLAFENCNCRHYITEKFFVNALSSDVIPVVFGAHPDDYRSVAPPNSYIHVDDFGSPKELADYLNVLDKNDDLYNKYFAWKGTGSFIDTKFWCRLCALLNDPDKPNLVVDSLSNWWRPPGVCIRQDQKWKDVW